MEEDRKAIVVILVGPPGSGKSTFCERVMQVSSLPWVRICQDTIGNGKAGTKIQCLRNAATALKEGKNVFIDRCNIDREQRAEFLDIGGPQVEKHAVVLDLPAKLCISRSVKRTGHEGHLQGGKAAAVVNRMLQNKELPKLSEGFARIMFCQDDKDVQDAISTYSALGPSASLPPGCYGQKNPGARVQLGIMKFLKKVDSSDNAGPQTKSLTNCSHGEAPKENDVCSGDHPATLNPTSMDVKECEEQLIGSSGDTSSSDSTPTLAFPSVSTADFHFNLEKASDIIVEKVEEFVEKEINGRLVLVDLSHGSRILSLVGAKAAQKNIDSKKFFTFVGDITKLKSKGGLLCNVIANAANWRLKPGGGGVNAAIYNAAGPALEMATKERAVTLSPGKAVAVPLPSTSPLFGNEGVTHIIHVLGPNMNPQRPDCLNDDYVKGCQILREAYSSLFECFASIINPQRGLSKGSGKRPLEAPYESVGDQISKGFTNEFGPGISQSGNGENLLNSKDGTERTKVWAPWTRALYQIAMHPEKHANETLEISDDVVVLYDLYPKAQKHLLVLTRVEGLDCLADVCEDHLQLLKTMHSAGLKWAERFLHENDSLTFRLGYHSVPSMRQLHLHVISQDFDSENLKNKKHWNSFNTPFFRDSVDVIEEVSKNGKATIKNDDSFRNMVLRCNRCRSAHGFMPRLKKHISSCKAPFPADLLENGRLIVAPGKDSSAGKI